MFRCTLFADRDGVAAAVVDVIRPTVCSLFMLLFSSS